MDAKRKPLERLLDAVLSRAHVLAPLLLVAGLLAFAALPLGERAIHFDENALLAGSARPTIRCGGLRGVPAPQSRSTLPSQMTPVPCPALHCATPRAHWQRPLAPPPFAPCPPPPGAPSGRDASPGALTAGAALAEALEQHWRSPLYAYELQRALARLGLEVYTQPFAVRRHGKARAAAADPAATAAAGSEGGASRGAAGGELRCANMHAVLRSPRGDGKEAIVLVTPVTLQPFVTGEAPAAPPPRRARMQQRPGSSDAALKRAGRRRPAPEHCAAGLRGGASRHAVAQQRARPV